MSRDNHFRSTSRSRSISRFRKDYNNHASKSYRSPPPPTNRYNRNDSPPSKRSRYQRERSRSRERNGRRVPSPTDLRRKNPDPSRVLGVFNLHVRTSEGEIREVFDRFGPIDEIIMVKDSKTRGFRGYCFIYYNKVRDATEALNHCNGIELKERIIRVDYSLSAKPHNATPGIYQGKRRRSFARPRSPMGRPERTRYYDRPIRNDDRDRIRRHRSADRAPTRRDDYNTNPSRSDSHRRRSREYNSPPRRDREYDTSRERGERHKKRA